MFEIVELETPKNYPSSINEDFIPKGTTMFYITSNGLYFKHCYLQKWMAQQVVTNLNFNRVRKLYSISFVQDIQRVTPMCTRGY